MVYVQLKEIEEYAKDNHVPIMLKDGIDFLTDYIKKNEIKSILEVGTAIGYSAISMALVSNDIKITTIERDSKMYDLAIKNIKSFNLESRVEVIFEDALNVEINNKYDLIFIDAAKSQYIKFFEKFKHNLNFNGVIVTDNLFFHGLVENPEGCSRNTRQLVEKIRKYVEFLKENKEFDTKFISIGDGISISKKIKKS